MYIKDEKGEDYLIQKEPLEKIWNSKYLKDVRKKMLNGERVSDCFYCYSQEDAGVESPRHNYNNTWYDNSAEHVVNESKHLDGHVERPPVSLEPRPGILCNLKCTMCWSMSSSKVYSERKAVVEGKIQDAPEFLIQDWKYEVESVAGSDFEWSDSPIYEESFNKCIPTLKRLYFTGGEPLLIKSNYKFVEKLLHAGKTDTLISFTTNLQLLDKKWIELLSHFSRVEITGSLDGLYDMNEYIRYPSQWSKVKENLDYLYNNHPKNDLSLMLVVQAMNVLSFPDIIEWVILNYPERQIQVIPTILQGPSHLSIKILTPQLRKKAAEKMHLLIEKNILSADNQRHLKNVLGHLSKEVAPNAAHLRHLFVQYVSYLDRQRGTSFTKTFPELQELFSESRLELK